MVEWTATVRIARRRQVRITRQAISPRLAIRTFENMDGILSEGGHAYTGAASSGKNHGPGSRTAASNAWPVRRVRGRVPAGAGDHLLDAGIPVARAAAMPRARRAVPSARAVG